MPTHVYDDGVFTRLELLQRNNFNTETIKSDLKGLGHAIFGNFV